MRQWLFDILWFNRESITLAVIIAAVTGPVFAITHEVTMRVMKWAKGKE